MEIRDTIERTMVFTVSRERVWKAITDPQQLAKWFGDRAEINRLATGEEILFGWEANVNRGIIEVVDPPRCFAYRWESGKNDLTVPISQAPTTLVTFTLEEVPEGTRLRVIESGFKSLPKDRQQASFSGNDSGWTAELRDLSEFLGEGAKERSS